MTYSVSGDVTIIERSVYSTFQLLGDVGGFQGLFLSVGATFVGFWNYYNAENFLIGNLFLSPLSKDKDFDKKLDPVKQYAFKEYLQESLPKFCLRMGCLKRSRYDKIFHKARNDLQQEMDLVKLLQKLRYFEDALSSILPPSKAKSLRDKNERLNLERKNETAVAPLSILEERKDDSSMLKSRMDETNSEYNSCQISLTQI